jgi:putative ABC transport system permease protein
MESLKEKCREQRGAAVLENICRDVRRATRSLLKNPGFTAAALFTLAVCIGANSAFFSVINTVLLRPLSYPEPDRLVTLWEKSAEHGREHDLVSGPNFLDWRVQSRSFEQMAVSPSWQGLGEFNFVRRDGTSKIRGSYVSAAYFDILGVKPLLGRAFLPEEDQREGNKVAILSHDLWRSRFGGDPNVIGQILTLDTYGRRDYTIVGVMPPGFGAPNSSELWLPIGWMGVSLTERRSAHWHTVLARLNPGVTPAQAQAELNVIQSRLKESNPGDLMGSEVAVVPLLELALGKNIRRALFILWGVVGGVLLIGCANVANLMLVRAATRQKEIAVRLALGASRANILRGLLVESVMLAVLGGGLGTLVSYWGIRIIVASSPANIPRLSAATLDGQVLGFTLVLSVITGVIFGLLPAWRLSRPDLNATLKGAGQTASLDRVKKTRGALVIVEVAVSVMLLAAAALMLRSFSNLLRVDRGFQPDHLVTAELDYSVSGFTTWIRPEATRPQVSLSEIMERIRGHPGVRYVGAVSALPRRDRNPPQQTLLVLGRVPLRPEERPTADQKGITPDFPRAIGMPLVRGRYFDETDTLQSRGVALVNEAFARQVFPNEDPIGKFITMTEQSSAPVDAKDRFGIAIWAEIVGVVGDLKTLTAEPVAVPEVYRPYWQWPMQSPTLFVRAENDPLALSGAIRRDIREVAPRLPDPVLRTMDDILGETVAQPRFQSGLLTVFGIVALILAAGGLYGVLSYGVSQRTHEIGIRMALGAGRGNLLSLVISQGLKLALIGLGVGLLGAIALTRLMGALLYEIKPNDPLTYLIVSLVLMGVALMACWLPARRATRVDPMMALRSE